eukprot:364905-Chlamydomonas_euryale.AAC.13
MIAWLRCMRAQVQRLVDAFQQPFRKEVSAAAARVPRSGDSGASAAPRGHAAPPGIQPHVSASSSAASGRPQPWGHGSGLGSASDRGTGASHRGTGAGGAADAVRSGGRAGSGSAPSTSADGGSGAIDAIDDSNDDDDGDDELLIQAAAMVVHAGDARAVLRGRDSDSGSEGSDSMELI